MSAGELSAYSLATCSSAVASMPELCAALLRVPHVGDQMDARRGRVDAPENNQRGFRIILIRDRGHLAVQRLVGGARRCRTDRARELRRAEAPPQLRVEIVLRQQT